HPSACVLRDGRLVAFAEEERFVRVKQALGYFPSHALRFCLDEAGLGLKDVDAIAFGWDATAYRWRFPLFLARSFVSHRLFGRRSRPRLRPPGPPRPAGARRRGRPASPPAPAAAGDIRLRLAGAGLPGGADPAGRLRPPPPRPCRERLLLLRLRGERDPGLRRTRRGERHHDLPRPRHAYR